MPNSFADGWKSCSVLVEGELVPTLKCVEVVFEILLFYSSILIMTGFFLMMVVGGMRYLTSGGNPEKLKKAQATLRWGVVGTLIFASAFLILQIIDVLFLGGAGKLFKFEISPFDPSSYTQPQPQPAGGGTTQTQPPPASSPNTGTQPAVQPRQQPPAATLNIPGSYNLQAPFEQVLRGPLANEHPDADNIRQKILARVKSYPQNIAIYKEAEKETGVPWYVLAGIHYMEGDSSPNQSLVSGRLIGKDEPDVADPKDPKGAGCVKTGSTKSDPIPLPSGGCGFSSLLHSALYAAENLKSKINERSPQTFQDLITAVSKYNGGGNSNCGKSAPYINCPPLVRGEDDAYALNLFDTRHEKMYRIYCGDHIRCKDKPPPLLKKAGVITAIRAVILEYGV